MALKREFWVLRKKILFIAIYIYETCLSQVGGFTKNIQPGLRDKLIAIQSHLLHHDFLRNFVNCRSDPGWVFLLLDAPLLPPPPLDSFGMLWPKETFERHSELVTCFYSDGWWWYLSPFWVIISNNKASLRYIYPEGHNTPGENKLFYVACIWVRIKDYTVLKIVL